MAAKWLVLPVLVHVLLVLYVLLKGGGGRREAVTSGQVKFRDIAIDSRLWPDNLRKLFNSYDNQFQLPMMFYVAVVFHIMLAASSPLAVVLAWGFVVARYVHCYIHIGTNNVAQRFYAFTAGVVALMALWVHLAVQLFFTG